MKIWYILVVKEALDFEKIVEAYLPAVFNFALRLVGSSAEAEDITQETFLKVWRNLAKFRPEGSIKPWIFAIARNTAFDFLRKKKAIPISFLAEEETTNPEDWLPDPDPLPDELFEKKETREALEKALSELRPEYREAVLLHLSEDLTFEEIAKIVGRPMNTVKSQYRRALAHLTKILSKPGHG